MKKVVVLQWRLLEGAVAVNDFLSVINRGVSDTSVQIKKLFSTVIQCVCLLPLFMFFGDLIQKSGEDFSKQMFILGFKNKSQPNTKVNL